MDKRPQPAQTDIHTPTFTLLSMQTCP